MKKIYLLLLFNLLVLSLLKAQIRYVKEGGSGAKNGSSWTDAADNLQAMIDVSSPGEQVWVAKGTYRPTQNLTGTADEDKSFVLKTGVKVYGGFLGTEPSTYDLSTRNFIANETILSGSFGGGVNAYHVVVNTNALTGVTFDGFTITGGNANGTGSITPGTFAIARNYGGGIFLSVSSNIELSNLILSNNLSSSFGGGCYLNYSGTEVIKLTKLKFVNNTATTRAGALYLNRSAGTAYVAVDNSAFTNNGPALGGAIFHNNGQLDLSNSTFENCTGTNGGAINNGNASTTVLNLSACTFKNNTAANGAAIYHYLGTANIDNTLFETNIATARGAGIYFNNGIIKLGTSTFNGNTATSDGGAIYRYGGSSFEINRTAFVNNVSSADGGAIKLIFGATIVNNALFYNNSAQDGGAIYTGNSAAASVAALVATNNTFYKNKDVAKAGAVSFLNTAGRTDIKLYNNILVENTSTNGAADIRTTSLETPVATLNIPLVLEYNLLQSSFSSSGNLAVANNNVYQPTLPLFASVTDGAANFLHLVEGQATEKGSNALATNAGILAGVDLKGNTRLQHGNVDLGAYEYQGVLPVQFDYFKAVKSGNKALLTWRTIAENHSSHFIVERAASPFSYKALIKKEAKGTISSPTTYQELDENPLAGTNYYRLVQYDENGDHQILGEQAVSFSLSTNEATVYPNPANKYVAIKLAETHQEATVDVVSLTGAHLISQQHKNLAETPLVLDLSPVPSGTYILWINKGKTNQEKKKLLVVK